MKSYFIFDERSEFLAVELQERARFLQQLGPESGADVLVFAAGCPLEVCEVELSRNEAFELRGLDPQDRVSRLAFLVSRYQRALSGECEVGRDVH